MPNLPSEKCAKAIFDASNGTMSMEESKAVIDQFNALLNKKRKTAGGQPLVADLLAEAKNIANAAKLEALRTRTHEILNRASRNRNLDEIKMAYKHDPAQGIFDGEAGGTGGEVGSLASVDKQRHAIFNLELQLTKNNMNAEAPGAFDLFISKKFDDEIVNAMEKIERGEEVSTSGEHSKQVNAVARELLSSNERMRKAAWSEGAFIGHYRNYIAARTHDVVKMKKIGYKTWAEDMERSINWDRTAPGADHDAFLKSTWNAILTGVRLDTGASTGRSGSANLAKAMSEERVIHFKTAADEIAHIRKYGPGSLSDAYQNGMSRMSTDIAILRKYGPSAAENRKQLIDDLKQWIRKRIDDGEITLEAGQKMLDKLDRPTIQHGFQILMGEMQAKPGSELAKWASFARVTQYMAKLGGSQVYGISIDPAVGISQLHFMGMNLGESIAHYMSQRANFAAGGDKDVLRGILAMNEGFSWAANKWSSGDTMSQGQQKAMKVFFQYNGTTPLDVGHRRAFEAVTQHYMARNKDTAFAELPERFRSTLESYKINASDWDMIRKAVFTSERELDYIQPAMLREKIAPDEISGPQEASWRANRSKELAALKKNKDATPAELAKQLDEGWERAKSRMEDKRYAELEQKLSTLLIDQTDKAINRPGVAEQIWLGMGYNAAGTIKGELWRTGLMFKSYPTAALRNLFARARGPNAVAALASYVGLTWAMAYFAMGLQDAIKGRDVRSRDWSDWKNHASVLSKSGGFGPYGDFLLDDVSISEGALGPIFGPAASMVEGARDSLREGKPTSYADDIVRRGKQMIPLQNFFATKTAFDYLIFNSIYESMNPGYLHRRELRTEQNGGATEMLFGLPKPDEQ